MTTRFLLTCISSYYFVGDKTLDGLHEPIAQDSVELYERGYEAVCCTNVVHIGCITCIFIYV